MELSKFLNLCGMVFGFIVAVFLSKVLFASANKLLQATFHYSSMDWPSKEIISSMANQKADTLASLIVVFLALGFQMGALFIDSKYPIYKKYKKGVCCCNFTCYCNNCGRSICKCWRKRKI